MGMAAILAMWPGLFEQTLFPHPMEVPYEMTLTDPVVSEEMFKDCGRYTNGRTTEAYLSCKLTNEPSAQVS